MAAKAISAAFNSLPNKDAAAKQAHNYMNFIKIIK